MLILKTEHCTVQEMPSGLKEERKYTKKKRLKEIQTLLKVTFCVRNYTTVFHALYYVHLSDLYIHITLFITYGLIKMKTFPYSV